MWSLLKTRSRICSQLRIALEEHGEVSMLPQELQQHLRACSSCQNAAADFAKSRALLRNLPSKAVRPGSRFVSRVMAAISAREAELRRSVDTWSVPRLAAIWTWVSAQALLLACTWLYQKPRYTAPPSADSGAESLLESSPAPANPDDVLVSRVETQQ